MTGGRAPGQFRSPARKVCIADLCGALLCAAIWRLTCLPEAWAFVNHELSQRPMRRLSPRKGYSVKELLQRVDRIAGDLNVLLVVIAIGLATLDLTFLVTQNVVNHLPPVTRVVYDSAPTAAR